MTCIGLVIFMHCFMAEPTVVSDFCDAARPLVTQDRYRPSQTDSERSKRRYAALKLRFVRLCKPKK